jgi:pantothenate kinase type III
VTSRGEFTAHPYIATKRGPLEYRNTNPLTRDSRWDVELSKTGYIHEAGRCLVMQALVADRRLYIVLLNAQGKLTPVADSNRLRTWLLNGGEPLTAGRIAYREPARLGVDRFLALIAAHRAARGTDHAGRPSLIIDAGTAITYDLLLANGTHLGGLILPGLGMMRDSLLAGTQIPPQASADAEVPWADDTAAAIAAGGLHAAGALAERLYQQLRDVDAGAGREPRLWLTGGDAERLASVIGPPVDQVPDLVLRGLAAFA